MPDPDAALREVAAIVSVAASHGCQRLESALAPVQDRLGIEYGDSPETVAERMREALGMTEAVSERRV